MDEAKLKAFKAHLEDSITEEEDDSNKYAAMADIAPRKYAPILHDIAREERIHRKHLRDILYDLEEWMTDHEEAPEEKV